jgi:hypothetical protein
VPEKEGVPLPLYADAARRAPLAELVAPAGGERAKWTLAAVALFVEA